MGTNAIIIKESGDGKYKGILIGSDGYLEYTGQVLLKDYTSDAAIEELMNLGNLSMIHGNPDQCIAYRRDYGRKGQHAAISNRWRDFGSASYIYFWKNSSWLVSVRSEPFIELKKEMCR